MFSTRSSTLPISDQMFILFHLNLIISKLHCQVTCGRIKDIDLPTLITAIEPLPTITSQSATGELDSSYNNGLHTLLISLHSPPQKKTTHSFTHSAP